VEAAPGAGNDRMNGFKYLKIVEKISNRCCNLALCII
jgi:hypothetical protein